MLRKIRIFLAVIVFVPLTLLFLDFTGTIRLWFGFLAKVQFLPALLASNFIIVLLLVAVTLIFGRIYCSVICPLGIMQDIIARMGRIGRKRKLHYGYSPAMNLLRYAVLALFVVMMLFGMAGIPALIAPYSSYGRIASELFAPVYAWLNNILAYFSGRLESYAFYSSDVWLKSGITLLVAAVSFAVIAVLAWRNGRTYCNTICPVGTVLGFLSRFSIFKIRISGDKCVGCKLCSRSCKASCIDIKNKKVDYSRCVACMDCIDNCVRGAISYSALRPVRETSLKQPDGGRRNFLSLSTLMIASAATASAKEKGGNVIAALERKKPYVRETPVVPPGAVGAKHFAEHCTACQLCVQSCTNDVLRPSGSIYHFMQPSMSYERGFCRPECTACSEVCPSGAILPVSREKKSSIQIGHAVWIRDNCIVITDGVHCGNCSRHCPSGAITMVKENPSDPHSARVPAVNEQRCIGCGACEYVCPARPFAAIHVEGHQMHKII